MKFKKSFILLCAVAALVFGVCVGILIEWSSERYMHGIPEGIVVFAPPGAEILDYTEVKSDKVLNPDKHEFLIYRVGGQIYRLHVYNRGYLGSTESTVAEDITPYINDLVDAAKKGNP